MATFFGGGKRVQIEAEVISINKRSRHEGHQQGASFRILTLKSRKYYDCFASFNLPLREGDRIVGNGVLERSGEKDIVRLAEVPTVTFDESKDGVIRTLLMNVKGMNSSKAKDLYEWVEKRIVAAGSEPAAASAEPADTPTTVIAWLDATADQLCREHIANIEVELQLAFPQLEIPKFLKWWHYNSSVRRLYLLGLSPKEVKRFYMAYDKAYAILLDNPYLMTSLPLERADTIAKITKRNLPPAQRRCGEIARQLLAHVEDRQWSCTPLRVLYNEVPDAQAHLVELQRALFPQRDAEGYLAPRGYGCVIEYDAIYLHYQHKVESEFAAMILERVGVCEERREPHFRTEGLQPSASQREAVDMALNNYVSIMYGEAGKGKSSAFRMIADNLDLYKEDFIIVSFTGKAVSRAKEVTGRKCAYTIHRSLSMELGDTETTLVDESSMVETPLMYSFLKAHPEIRRIVFTGDPYQLLTLSWGSMFTQLLKAGTIPMIELREQHRQQIGVEGDVLYDNLQRILARAPVQAGDNFHLCEGGFGELLRVVNEMNDYGKKFIIISPVNRVLNDVNLKVRDIVNPDGLKVVEPRGMEWRKGDTAMVLENLYSLGLYNGSVLTICDVYDDAIQLQNEDGKYKIPFQAPEPPAGQELDERDAPVSTKSLTLAYAMSTHKVQGSETDVAIVYIPEGVNASGFFCNNLVYTATSRAKKEVFIVGNIREYQAAIYKDPCIRHENLYRRLQEQV